MTTWSSGNILSLCHYLSLLWLFTLDNHCKCGFMKHPLQVILYNRHMLSRCLFCSSLPFLCSWMITSKCWFSWKTLLFVLLWLVLSPICMLWRDELGISNFNLQLYWWFITEHWYQLPPFETCSCVELLKTLMKTAAATTSFQGIVVLSPKHFYLRRKALPWARVYTVSF